MFTVQQPMNKLPSECTDGETCSHAVCTRKPVGPGWGRGEHGDGEHGGLVSPAPIPLSSGPCAFPVGFPLYVRSICHSEILCHSCHFSLILQLSTSGCLTKSLINFPVLRLAFIPASPLPHLSQVPYPLSSSTIELPH